MFDWWVQFLADAGLQPENDRKILAQRLIEAHVDESLLGDLTKHWLSDIGCSIGQRMKILKYRTLYMTIKQLEEAQVDTVGDYYITEDAGHGLFSSSSI